MTRHPPFRGGRVVLVLCTVLSGCSSKPKDAPAPLEERIVAAPADEPSARQSTTIKSGQTLVVRLPKQAGTGYAWRLANDPDVHTLRVLEQSSDRQGQPMPGGGEFDVFRFRGERRAIQTLSFDLTRPFEKGAVPAKTFQLDVQVTK